MTHIIIHECGLTFKWERGTSLIAVMHNGEQICRLMVYGDPPTINDVEGRIERYVENTQTKELFAAIALFMPLILTHMML